MKQEERAELLDRIVSSGNVHIGQMIIGDKNTVNYHEAAGNEETQEKVPQQYSNQQMTQAIVELSEKMKQAVLITCQQGLWWSSRSWAVVYRVWQLKGYKKGMSDFVREVEGWNLDVEFECLYDAIQKPVSKGIYAGTPDGWIDNGAPHQALKLARALLLNL